MISHRTGISSLVGLAVWLATARAGFKAGSASNLALYWGQNSYQQPTGKPNTQERLAYYCASADIDIIPIAFLSSIVNPTTVNFANAGDNCTQFEGSTLLNCPQLEADITTCQQRYGKTILLSIGGATYTEGGFSSPAAAMSAADKVWAMFGPIQPASQEERPFGSAVIDGFDFDFESATSNMVPFAKQLRSLMDSATAAGDKRFYLSAAPQCPYPDVADREMLDGTVAFDFVMVQFYNNYCGVQSFAAGSASQNNFNFAAWDDWARRVSLNMNVRILLGVPGNTGAGAGYQSATQLSPILSYARQFASFGGVMIWDTSQTYANAGFLEQVAAGLGPGSAPGPPSTEAPPPAPGPPQSSSTLASSVPATTAPVPTQFLGSGPVPRWGQCGGAGYRGPTQCAPSLTCVGTSDWWSQCQ